MALMQNIWKMKASIRSAAGFRGEFLRGLTDCLFDNEILSPVLTRGPEYDLVTAPAGYWPSHRSFGYSLFSKIYPSSCNLAAGHRTSSSMLMQYKACALRETISGMFSTSTTQCSSPRGCRCSFVDLASGISGTNLEKLLEAGLNLTAGQISGGFLSSIVKAIAPELVMDIKFVGLQQVRNDHRLSDLQTQMDPDAVVNVEACKWKPSLPTSRHNSTRALQDVDGFCEADDDFEAEGHALGGNIDVCGVILENIVRQGPLHARRVSGFSIAHYSLDHGSLVSVLEDSHGSFAGKESSLLEFCGRYKLRYLDTRSMILDNERVQHRNLRLLSGACCLPHPNKVKTGGEDAYFISSGDQVVGVADGVGGWADVGVDAGDYARELMLQAKLAVAQEPHGYVDVARVLIRAHARTKCRGSSTACILALSDHGLQAANLGDSGFVMMRSGRTIFKSPVQQHLFNIPFQLENGGSDPPSSAEVFSLQVAAGDVLVAGTDGLFDNLYDNELMGIVMHSTRAGLDPQVTAHNIAALARERAEDRNRQTPFSTAAQDAGFRFYGGKMDDITVVVSFVTTIKPGLSKM